MNPPTNLRQAKEHARHHLKRGLEGDDQRAMSCLLPFVTSEILCEYGEAAVRLVQVMSRCTPERVRGFIEELPDE